MDEAEKIFLLENEMEVEYRQIHEVLRCLIHTIVFNRALGSTPLVRSPILHIQLAREPRVSGCITPVEVDSELFDDVTYVKCDDQKVQPCFRLPIVLHNTLGRHATRAISLSISVNRRLAG